jgi:conjugative relaxase-like TrwC/TraI family protein
MKIYHGAAAAARHYVEADRSRGDDYYLAEGSGIAVRIVANRDGADEVKLERRPDMDGDTYEQWVAGVDVESGRPKGRLRTDDQAVRFVEVTVNGPKTWSLAAALHDDVAAAYDAAQMAAAEEITGWLAAHATTRVGPRGRQVQVPVEEIEAAVVRHFTSRAGDPHRHLHLQINARVWARDAWRGLHTVGVRDSLEALNGIGHAAVMTKPEFRAALADHGYSLDPETGETLSWRRTPAPSALGRDRSRRTSIATRPSGGATTPARSRGLPSDRRGTGELGPTPDPTRSSPSRELNCATVGSRNSPTSASACPPVAPSRAGPRSACWIATPWPSAPSTGSAPAAPPGTPPTSAARSRRSSRPAT